MEKINTLEWERVGYKKTIRKRESEKAYMAATYKEKEEELMADTKKEVRLIEGDLSNSRHRVRNLLQKWAAQGMEIKELKKENEELREAYEGVKKQLAAAAWENQALLEAHNAEYREKRGISKLVQVLLKNWESERKEYNYKSK